MTHEPLTSLIADEMKKAASDQPLYRQLKSALETALRINSLRPGAVLPGERVLAEALSLSRVTVRKALSLLADEGTLNRRHGFRTEIGARVEKSLATLTSFSEDIRARGLIPGCLWISKEISQPSPTEMMALGISGNAGVLRMKRVRTADGAPMAVEVATVPARFLPSPELVGDSLYEAMNKRGLMPQRAIQRMRSRPASIDDARHLACEAGAPILATERRCFLADGQVVEYCETRYKGDIYDFIFELHR